MAPVSGAVRVLIDNTFTSNQKAGIHAMIVQWNQIGQAIQNNDFFVEEAADVPDVLRTGNFQSCELDVGTGSGSFYLVNEASSLHWSSLGFSSLIPGATMRCYASDLLSSQVVMIRPDLVADSQFTSVILHELGHSLGLDHSCKSGDGSSNFISCSGLSNQDPYYQAVMYPTLGTGGASGTMLQIKDQLQSNDTSRISCLY